MPDVADLGLGLKKIVTAVLLVPGGPLFSILVGLWLAPRRPRLGLTVIGAATLVLFTLSLPVVANQMGKDDERAFPPFAATGPLPANAAIVVLGGGLEMGATDYGGETVNPITLVRLRSAARLAAETRLPILVSGGRSVQARFAEAELMAESLDRDFHTPVRWQEKRSLDTDDNARFSARLLADANIDAVVLVTDVQHMRRARALFEAAGMTVVPAPTDYHASAPIGVLSFLPSTGALRRSSWSIHEWVGMLWSRLQGLPTVPKDRLP